MTREEILQMDDAELIDNIICKFGLDWDWIVAPYTAIMIAEKINLFLWFCYQAEEKIKEMGLKKMKAYFNNLQETTNRVMSFEEHLSSSVYMQHFCMIHAHPKQRAQAVLLTVEEKANGEDR